MTIGQKALREAIADIGVREEPLGSNTGRRVRQMQANTWLPGTRWPWCAAAVCTWYREAGFRLPDPSAGAKDLTDRAVRNGWGVGVPVRDGRPGDIVSFNVGSGHVALLQRYDPKTGLVHTVDGNASDQVKRCARPAAAVYRCVRVKHDHAPTVPDRPPRWQVVTSETGRDRIVFRSRSLDKALGQAATLLRRGASAVTVRPRPAR